MNIMFMFNNIKSHNIRFNPEYGLTYYYDVIDNLKEDFKMYSKTEKRKKKVDKVKRKYELKAKIKNSVLLRSFYLATGTLFVISVSAASFSMISNSEIWRYEENRIALERYVSYGSKSISEHIHSNITQPDEKSETVVVYNEERKGETPIQPFPEEIVDETESMCEPILIEENSIIYEDLGNIDEDVVNYMYKAGEEQNIPGEILQAIAKIESNYNPNAVSKTNDHGLMQINASNFGWLSEKGINDWYDPYQSIDAAIIIINETRKSANTDNWNKILMAYNSGVGNAKKKWKKGIYSSTYSKEVLSLAEEFGYTD